MTSMLEKINSDEKVLEVVSDTFFNISTAESKEALAVALYKEPQEESPVYHRFGPGIYMREAHYKAGTLVVGHEHVHEHTNVLLKGKILLSDGAGGTKILEAPFIFTAPPGRKVGYIIEDVVWMNVYSTDERNIESLESTLFRESDSWIKEKQELLLSAFDKHEEDRKDYKVLLEESGWTEEQVKAVASYEGDHIPFPDGVYSVCPSESPIQGKGLFATAPFKLGDTIAPMRLNGYRTPAGYLVNHSKNPNCVAVMVDNMDIFLVAGKEIEGMHGGKLGDELTIDYRHIMKINDLWRGD